MPEREQASDDKSDQLVGISGNVDFHFYFYVGEIVTILTIGSLYSFDFCRDTVFICTSISKNKELYKFTFLLCSLVEGKVESVDGSVCCTLNDNLWHMFGLLRTWVLVLKQRVQ